MGTGKWQGSKWITKHKRLAIYMRDSFTCVYCGRDLRNAKPEEINLDHVQPRCQGGNNEATNLITACKTCNCTRQDKPVTEYADAAALERINTQRVIVLNVKLALSLVKEKAAK